MIMRASRESKSAKPCGCGSCAKTSSSCVQRKRDSSGDATAAERPHIAHVVDRTLASAGRPLDSTSRTFFGSKFGHDFSRVRVFADDSAWSSARALSAKAFTVGQNVVFGRGQYEPSSTAGRRLIGHELAHVVQQTRTPAAPVSPAAVSALDAEADRASDAALTGPGRVNVLGAAKGGVQFNAEVYVWNPHVDGYGHAAIKLCDGTYISWWPVGGGSKKDQYWGGRPGGSHSPAEDLAKGTGEGQAPDNTYDLGCNCLDEKAMKDWYTTNFSSNPSAKWGVLRNSCSDIAHQAINAGSSVTNPCYLSLSHTNLFWTPKDLGAYAECQERWCKSKAAGTLNATGRYVWENVKELAGGALINTLKSFWWKGEIIAH